MPVRSHLPHALVAVAAAAVLAAGCSVPLSAAPSPSPRPTPTAHHIPLWYEGYQFAQQHAIVFQSSMDSSSHWCAVAAYEDSGYGSQHYEYVWALGCRAALNGQPR